ncbi:MAG: sugar phosphate isomerase/epimerase [Lachnospiraceae bacterium]|nr:sugar phosphate isomerase/epimerase [Lachnospiraceae bacterium]
MWNTITLSGFADEISTDLSEQIRVLKNLDVSYVEMRGVNGKGLVYYTLPEVREIKQQLDAEGIRLSSVGSPIGKIGIADDFAPHMDLFKHTVEIAKIMETPNIRMFSFFIPQDQDPSVFRGEVMDRLGQMADYAAASDVVLLHENEKEIYGDNAPRCLEIMKEFYGDHFKAVFDFANFVQCDQDTLEAYEMLKPYISYIHIKDALFGSGEVVPAGHGDGNVAKILSMLKESGYQGFLSLEPHLQQFSGFSALENSEGTVQKERKYTGEEVFTIAHHALCEILEKI